MAEVKRYPMCSFCTAFILLVAAVLFQVSCSPFDLFDQGPTPTPEPIVPTRTPPAGSEVEVSSLPPTQPLQNPGSPGPGTENSGLDLATASATAKATTVSQEMPSITATPPPDAGLLIGSELDRFGVTAAVEISDAEHAYAAGLPFGSLLNWNVLLETPHIPAVFWQMIRVNEAGIRRVTWEGLAEAIAANPGSYWLIGNEPDVLWQDNVTPQRYAEIYHDVYTFIKERDAAAKVVIGGVSQPTPLRRAYLDIVLDTYQMKYGEPMPVDIWNVHAFTLREEKDSWGVDIPPGMTGAQGILYEIDDHDDVEILRRNLLEFRQWMADRGYADKPLVISEYGILMPEDYGFPPEDVAAYMTATFDLFREMTSQAGYAPDGNRLVQWWFWFSLYDNKLYPTGNLWDAESGEITELGEVWIRYVGQHVMPSTLLGSEE